MTLLIMGIGDSGVRVLDQIASEKLQNIKLVSVNTHIQSNHLEQQYDTILIGQNGPGSGGNPSVGQQAVVYSANTLHTTLNAVKRLLIVCGFGGGTGTGAAPAIARYASTMDIETIGIISLPFKFEGDYRQRIATQNLVEMHKFTRETAVINSDDIVKWMKFPDTPSIQDAYSLLDHFMAWNVLTRLK